MMHNTSKELGFQNTQFNTAKSKGIVGNNLLTFFILTSFGFSKKLSKMISLRGEVWSHKTRLNQPLFIEVPYEAAKMSRHIDMCKRCQFPLGFYVFRLDSGTVRVWLVGQELLTLPEHMSSTQVLVGFVLFDL